VRWEVAEDDKFTRVIARGVEAARSEEAHSVHVEVVGLRAGRWYWYRFVAGGIVSPVGRARTAPSVGGNADRLRLVLASCQNWEHGYLHAWRHAAAEAADMVCFVGDYIYEYGANPRRPLQARPHQEWAAVSLAQYRDRYALYKTDADLQAAHAAAPWVLTWDDHEVVNDYAADRPELLAQKHAFLARRAAAYQAFWEHTPMRRAQKPVGPDATVYRRLGWGRLARLHVVDDRQYRDYQVCPKSELGGGSTTVGRECPDRERPERTMLGAAQERWLAEGLQASDSRWNLLVQQTLFAPFNQGTRDAPRWWTDAWDGYPAARERLVRVLANGQVRNPVILGGDVHCFYATDIPAGGPGGPGDGRVVATEFVGSSISSRGWSREQLGRYLPQNPHIRFAEPERRGYAVMDVTATQADVRFRAIQDVMDPASGIETLAKFAVLDGAPGVRPG
jgi:alkaline phosphatase D